MSSLKLPTPQNTRLVTIVAHVDHGKTTLADNLIEHNGIISERLAGSIRYLDSNEEEQRRGITMKSSAIALKHEFVTKNPKADSSKQTMVIHLIDSPGHVDFGCEVTSALLACDGALVVVDVVEGMCARTQAVLREAYANELIPILVINKVDRLQSDLGLSPKEAYLRIRALLESVNAAAWAMVLTDRSEADAEASDNPHTNVSNQQKEDDEEETVWNFDPGKGNVVFCSALHGWGFTVPSLARALFRSKTLPFKPPILRQALFADCRYNEETGKIVKWKHDSNSYGDDEKGEPLFAYYGLRPIWEIYEGVAQAAATVGITSSMNAATAPVPKGGSQNAKICASTSGMDMVLSALQTASQVLNSSSVPTNAESLQAVLTRVGAGSTEESVLRAILRRYRPLSECLLDTACEIFPSPSEATSSIRTRALALKDFPKSTSLDESALAKFQSIARVVKECDASPTSPTVAHVCKFVSIRHGDVTDPELKARDGSKQPIEAINPNQESLYAVTRVLSGLLQDTVDYEVYGPGFDPSTSPQIPKKRIKLYLLMGASLIRIKAVPAGHICAVADLSDLQLKTMTLCDTPGGMPLRGFEKISRPLVKVNVEPVKSSEAEILERGLLKLALGDAAVEVTATSKGERLLACQGELHLEQSILELKKVYCEKPIELRISDPIAEYGESTDWFDDESDYLHFLNSKRPDLRQTTIPPYNEEDGISNARLGRCRPVLAGRAAALRIRTLPLRRSVFDSIKEKKIKPDSQDEIENLARAVGYIKKEETFTAEVALEFILALSKQLRYADTFGNCVIEAAGVIDKTCVKGVLDDEVYKASHDPKKEVDEIDQEQTEETEIEDAAAVQVCNGLTKQIKENPSVPKQIEIIETNNALDDGAYAIWRAEMRGSLTAGFQLAMRAGPFCEEPVRGVLVILEGVEIALTSKGTTESYTTSKAISGGMVVSAIRQGIRCSMLTRPARIVEAHFRLTLHSSLAGLGPLYDVLNKRRGKVVSDTMVDGTDLIMITANLPQQEAFGLGSELLKKTSGEVTAPELVFSHFEVLKEDPFWAPTTEDEIEEFGQLLMNGLAPSTGEKNNALGIIREVRKRKGLLVDSGRIVVAAEKQRTLARKK